MKKIIFTDLDGTLLDHSNYSFEAALPALQLIKEKNIPLIICSSKTRKEIELYRKKLYNLHPFISENGGGIFIPKGYFESRDKGIEFKVEEEGAYNVFRLGARYSDLRKAIGELRAEGFNVKGFGDMTVEEVSVMTGLSIDEAEMATERDFDEPFIFVGAIHELPLLIDAIKKKMLNYTQGHFHHILGNSDKGKAVAILTDLYGKEYGEITTIAVGDSPNDIPMLERVDYPVIVQKHDGKYDRQIHIPSLIKADGIGPDGWNQAVLKLLL
ncbi:MAG: HAD-IIB family hydrolase [Nitrospirae bacterium]|nr:HAD-IIB family hydrolase [Nitrospirota bacterium]